MRTFKRTACLCLMLLLLLSFPTALIVSAAELDTGQTTSAQAEINTLDESIICQAASITQEENGGISLTSGGSEGGIVGGGTSGGGASSSYSGTAQFISPGVTFEVITVPYGSAYDRETVYNAVIQYLTDMKGVFGGAYSTVNTFILDTTDAPDYGGSLIRLSVDIDGSGRTESVNCYGLDTGYSSGDKYGYHLYYNCQVDPTTGVTSGCSTGVSRTTGTRVAFKWKETEYTDSDGNQAQSHVVDFIKQVIAGTDILDYHKNYYTWEWDIGDVETENSTYAQMLKLLGCSDELIQNYLDAYNGKLDKTKNKDTKIPVIIWASVCMEMHPADDGEGVGYVYTAYDAASNDSYSASYFESKFWKNAYTSQSEALAAYVGLGVTWDYSGAEYPHNNNTYTCKCLFGNHLSGTLTFTNWDPGYDGDTDYHNGYAVAGSGWVNRIQANGVDATAEDGTNTFYYLRNYWAPYGDKDPETTRKVQIAKTADCSAAVWAEISGNSLYSLAGAEYKVYDSSWNYMETLTTDSDGTATSSLTYAVGFSGYLVETVAPPGYKLNTEATNFEVVAGDGVQEISVTDEPVFDPIGLQLQKIDANTGTAQGDGDFNCAVFKVEYYTNYTWSGTAERTWYFATESNGYWEYDSHFLDIRPTNDELYVDADGKYSLPLGSVKITEISSSTGYTVLSDSLYLTITQGSSGVDASAEYTTESMQYLVALASGQYAVYEPVDTDSYGGVIVYKEDYVAGGTAQGAATLEGAEFQIINKSANAVTVNGVVYEPDEVCLTLTTDANGYAASGNVLPIGTYQIKESKAPEGYQLSSATETFSITSSVKSFTWTCKDYVVVGGIQIIKQSSVELDNTDANAGLDGITFSVINNNDQSVYIVGVEYQPGEVCYTMELRWFQSNYWSGWIAIMEDWFPYGDYIIRENVSATVDGNDLANPYYLACDDIYVTIDENEKTLEFTVVDELYPGQIEISKVDATTGNDLSGAKFLLEWSTDGTSWEPVFYSATLTQGGCSTCDADGCVVTDTAGGGYFYGLDPRLYYRLTEVDAPEYYAEITDPIFVGMLPTDDPSCYLALYQTVENELYPGQIEIYKVSNTGQTLDGAKFLLEWSTDGKTWQAVTYSSTVIQGGCNSCDADGCVVSANGECGFYGLDPRLYYRVTEVEAPEGYLLLTDSAWEGVLPTDRSSSSYLEIGLTVYNSPGFSLPATGESAMLLTMLGGFGLALAAVLAILFFAMGKKRRGGSSSAEDTSSAAVQIDRNTQNTNKIKKQNLDGGNNND